MIYAVTMNPAIDKYICIDDFELNQTNYYKREIKKFGGKAINVVKMLDNFTSDYKLVTKYTTANEKFILENLENINSKLFITKNMRTNYKINSSGKITEFNQKIDISSTDTSSKAIMNYLIEEVTHLDIVIFTGSFSEKEIEEIKKFRSKFNQLKIIVDSSSITLEDLKIIKPFVYKPNIEELNKLFNEDISRDILSVKTRILNQIGIEHVIVSLGEEGGMYTSNDQHYLYKTYNGNVVNTVGAGDSFLAGFTYSLTNGVSPVESVIFANACGAATVFSEDIGKKIDIETLLNQEKQP